MMGKLSPLQDQSETASFKLIQLRTYCFQCIQIYFGLKSRLFKLKSLIGSFVQCPK